MLPIIAALVVVLLVVVVFLQRSLVAKQKRVHQIAAAIGSQLTWRYTSIDRLLKEASDSGIPTSTITTAKAAKSDAIRASEALARTPESANAVKGLSKAEQRLRQALRDVIVAVESAKASGSATQSLDARISDLAASDTELKSACATYNSTVEAFNKTLDGGVFGIIGSVFKVSKAVPLQVRRPEPKLGAYARGRTSGSRPVVS